LAVHYVVTGSPFPFGAHDLVMLVLEDVTELVELRRIVPMCANCRKIRDNEEYWMNVEEYLSKHTSMLFSHGLCGSCTKALYPDIEFDLDA